MTRGLPAVVALLIALSASAGTAQPKAKRKGKATQTAAPKPAATAKAEEKTAASPGRTTGEVANTDIFKNMLSMRTADKSMRDFTITEATKIVREVKGKPDAPIQFEAIQIGEPVELFSQDGKTASEVRVRSR